MSSYALEELKEIKHLIEKIEEKYNESLSLLGYDYDNVDEEIEYLKHKLEKLMKKFINKEGEE